MVEAAAAAGWDGTGGAPALFVFPYQLVQRIRRSVGGQLLCLHVLTFDFRREAEVIGD